MEGSRVPTDEFNPFPTNNGGGGGGPTDTIDFDPNDDPCPGMSEIAIFDYLFEEGGTLGGADYDDVKACLTRLCKSKGLQDVGISKGDVMKCIKDSQ